MFVFAVCLCFHVYTVSVYKYALFPWWNSKYQYATVGYCVHIFPRHPNNTDREAADYEVIEGWSISFEFFGSEGQIPTQKLLAIYGKYFVNVVFFLLFHQYWRAFCHADWKSNAHYSAYFLTNIILLGIYKWRGNSHAFCIWNIKVTKDSDTI